MSHKNERFEEKWTRFKTKIKEDPTARAVCITAVVLVLAVSLLITVTAIANRARRGHAEGTTGGETTVTAPDTTGSAATPDTDPPESTPVSTVPTSFLLPAEGSLAKKHDATAQVFSNTMQDYRVHLGIDITTEEAAPVYAAADGTVKKIWEDVRYGQCVAIEHGGECVTVYKNLAVTLEEGIKEGAKISAGALIGAVGDTAMVEIADDPHLHFEMTVKGLAVDPLDYFDEAALASLSVDTAYEG